MSTQTFNVLPEDWPIARLEWQNLSLSSWFHIQIRWDLSCSRKCSYSFMYYGMCSVNIGRHRRHRTICFNQIAHLRNNNNSDAENWPRVEMKVNRQITFWLKYDWVESNSSWEISKSPTPSLFLRSNSEAKISHLNFTTNESISVVVIGTISWKSQFLNLIAKSVSTFAFPFFVFNTMHLYSRRGLVLVWVAHAICISAFRIRRCDRTMHWVFVAWKYPFEPISPFKLNHLVQLTSRKLVADDIVVAQGKPCAIRKYLWYSWFTLAVISVLIHFHFLLLTKWKIELTFCDAVIFDSTAIGLPLLKMAFKYHFTIALFGSRTMGTDIGKRYAVG